MSRKELDDLTAEAKQAGAKGLVWIKVTAEGLNSTVAKFLSAAQDRLLSATAATPGDLHALLISAVERPLIEVVLERAGGNQVKAAEMLGINRNTLRKKITTLGIAVPRAK